MRKEHATGSEIAKVEWIINSKSTLCGSAFANVRRTWWKCVPITCDVCMENGSVECGEFRESATKLAAGKVAGRGLWCISL